MTDKTRQIHTNVSINEQYIRTAENTIGFGITKKTTHFEKNSTNKIKIELVYTGLMYYKLPISVVIASWVSGTIFAYRPKLTFPNRKVGGIRSEKTEFV